MPFRSEYCDPQYILTISDGTRIYRDYKDGDYTQVLTCHYQLKDKICLGSWLSFDVRDLPPGGTHQDRIRAAGRAAHEAGLSFQDYLRSCDIAVYDSYG